MQKNRSVPSVVAEEERVLQRVLASLERAKAGTIGQSVDYDAELLSLRDQLAESRTEDQPPILEAMDRLQRLAQRRTRPAAPNVDRQSPYFGRLVVDEGERRREVLIGRGTFVDEVRGVRIVDWRDAPISRIYYRYDEGDDYEEVFGGKDVEGEVQVRRNVSIVDGALSRVVSPQGRFERRGEQWLQVAAKPATLAGGQGLAPRPSDYRKVGDDVSRPRFGQRDVWTGEVGARRDKHLAEITSLIDPNQFELITQPSARTIVIQGGAGSGKTTVGLHRVAFLAFQDAKRFASHRMVVLVYNRALARYIERVLPALGVEGVKVFAFSDWARRLRNRQIRGLPLSHAAETPQSVARFKKHALHLHALHEFRDRVVDTISREIESIVGDHISAESPLRRWRSAATDKALLPRLELLRNALARSPNLSVALRHQLERVVNRGLERYGSPVELWAEYLGDKQHLRRLIDVDSEGGFTDAERSEIINWCNRRCALVLGSLEQGGHGPQHRGDALGERRTTAGDDGDGPAELDAEDEALLLRLCQLFRGEVPVDGSFTTYAHVFVDEAQDMSPVELAVVMATAGSERCVTLAGDTSQRMDLDNGFSDWRQVLRLLGLKHTGIKPLRLSYRSTKPILQFAHAVLGPLAPEQPPSTTREGLPVEVLRFAHVGEAISSLGEALRELMHREPLASVAVVARYPEQADIYFEGLRRSEVPFLRRVDDQDFAFRPGVDVTDVRQVKGLEFDYVVLVEANPSSYPESDSSRFLLHIGATRAAHQLWVVATGELSKLLPAE